MNKGMKYQIYFHNMLRESEDVDEKEVPTGDYILTDDDYEVFLNPKLTIKFLEGFPPGYGPEPRELHFECWLDFETNDKFHAIEIAPQVLEENDLGWVDIFMILDSNKKVVYESKWVREGNEGVN